MEVDRIRKYLNQEQLKKFENHNKSIKSPCKKEDNQELFEDSSILAEYIIEDKIKDVSKFNNISDLNEYLKIKGVSKYNFGDLLSFSGGYRSGSTIIIGKNGKLIHNPDFGGSGYLTIPYEITQYLTDATNKYKDIDFEYMDLRYDDKYIKKHIGIINKEWNFKFTLYQLEDTISIEYPNGIVHDFDVSDVSVEDIYNFYIGSQMQQSKIHFNYSLKGNKYDEFILKYGENLLPEIPSTWAVEYGGSGGGYKEMYGDIYIKGPIENLTMILDKLNLYYDGFDAKISIINC